MHVAVLGAGGLGSVVGGYLARAGTEVTLIGRPAHVEAIRADGLRITGVRGEHTISERLRAVTDPSEVEGQIDYLMLGVKGKDTKTALAQADGLRGRIGAALSLQNNIVKSDRLAEWIGRDKVIGAATIEGATALGPGRVLNGLTVPTTFYLGDPDGGTSDRVDVLAEALNHADLGAKTVENIRQVEWEKLAQVCIASSWSVSTLGAAPSLGFADGLAVREGAAHYVQLAKEIVSVYRALGYEPQDFFAPVSRLKALADSPLEDGVAALSRLSEDARLAKAVRTSMHEDLVAGRKTEVDEILLPVRNPGRGPPGGDPDAAHGLPDHQNTRHLSRRYG